MRIALLVGVSEYDALENLPAATEDVQAMENIVRATGEYSEVIVLSGRLTAEALKKKVLARFRAFDPKSVEETLFYYSGHGSILGNDLVFPMSDWADKRPRQTSLENSELDDWLRSLEPAVAVKILDCCYSGMRYVKSSPDFEAALQASGKGFETCYFYFSSRRDQVSYASEEVSEFTREFLTSVCSRPDGPVRYKDLMDVLIDAFDDADQEPQFVAQGSMREVFCEVGDAVRSAYRPTPQRRIRDEVPQENASDLLGAVKKGAEVCIDKKEAAETLKATKEQVQNALNWPALEPFFELGLKFEESWDFEIAEDEVIGNWLKNEGRAFFGRALESERQRRTGLATAIDPFGPLEGPKVTGFVSTASLEYDAVVAMAQPRFPNLLHHELVVVLLWSKTELVAFSYSTPLKDEDWERQARPDRVRWQYRRFNKAKLSDLGSHIHGLVSEFWVYVEGSIRKRFENTS